MTEEQLIQLQQLEKRIRICNRLTVLKYKLETKLDESKAKGIDITEQKYLVENLDEAIDLIHLLWNDNEKLTKK